MDNCELCGFENPKCSVTAVIIKDNKILLLKRNEQPFKGMMDLPGGYVSKGESLEIAIKREVKEELGIDCSITKIGSFHGSGTWKDDNFPVMNTAFLVGIDDEIQLNEENSLYEWMPIKDVRADWVAFDSNQDILMHIKKNFLFNLNDVKGLIQELDSSAVFDEQRLYKAIIDGKVECVYEGDTLVGMGWFFVRQTMLRNQAVVEDMIVSEKCRGKGYGRELLHLIIAKAKSEGVDVMELTTGHHRVAAGKLYESEGFKLHDTRHMLLKL